MMWACGDPPVRGDPHTRHCKRSDSALSGRPVRALCATGSCAVLADERRRLTPQLNGGQRGWNYDEAAVAQAACELAAGRFFGTEYDLGQVREVISFLGEVNIAKGTAIPPEQEMEAVGWSEAQVVGLISEAEAIAFNRGWNPPLVS
jgi:hypothetical protein